MIRRKFQVSKTQVDGDPATLLLFQPVGIDAGQSVNQCSFSVVDVTGSTNNNVAHSDDSHRTTRGCRMFRGAESAASTSRPCRTGARHGEYSRLSNRSRRCQGCSTGYGKQPDSQRSDQRRFRCSGQWKGRSRSRTLDRKKNRSILLLLLDISGSMRKNIEQMSETARDALKFLSPGDRVAIMTFGVRTHLHFDFFDNHAEVARQLRTAVDDQEEVGYGTAINSAIIDAARFMDADQSRVPAVRF